MKLMPVLNDRKIRKFIDWLHNALLILARDDAATFYREFDKKAVEVDPHQFRCILSIHHDPNSKCPHSRVINGKNMCVQAWTRSNSIHLCDGGGPKGSQK